MQESAQLPGSERWRPTQGLLALLLIFSLSQVAVLLLLQFDGLLLDGAEELNPTGVALASLLLHLSLIAVPLLLLLGGFRVSTEQFGLCSFKLYQAARWLLLVAVIYYTATLGWSLLFHSDEQQEIVESLGVSDSTLRLLIGGLQIVVVAPLVEEFFFRGFLFVCLRNWAGFWPAALISGGIFGLVHAAASPLIFLPPLALFGVLLCLLYQRTGSLIPCIALHCINNLVAFWVSI